MKLAIAPGPSLPEQMVGFSAAWMLESTGRRAPELLLPAGLCNALPVCSSKLLYIHQVSHWGFFFLFIHEGSFLCHAYF